MQKTIDINNKVFHYTKTVRNVLFLLDKKAGVRILQHAVKKSK